MKISELLRELIKVQALHGDIPVHFPAVSPDDVNKDHLTISSSTTFLDENDKPVFMLILDKESQQELSR